jgi:DNA polymerase-4
VRSGSPARRILHIDLDPFFVAVERSLDPTLKNRPVVVGGDGLQGIVAAASAEARAAGVRHGQTIRAARRICPEAVFRPGDLETYSRISQDVTQILLTASRRLERPSIDEVFVELTVDAIDSRQPFRVVDHIQDEIHRRLGLDASFGLASTRLAARIASRFAKPHGLLILLPEHEASFVARQSIDVLSELTPTRLDILNRAGLRTVGDLMSIDRNALISMVGTVTATMLKDLVTPHHEPPLPIVTPPAFIQEEMTIRDRHTDRADLEALVESLCRRALKRIRPFDLRVVAASIDVQSADSRDRRTAHFHDGISDERMLAESLKSLARPLLVSPNAVRVIHLRLGPFASSGPQFTLFPELDATAHGR